MTCMSQSYCCLTQYQSAWSGMLRYQKHSTLIHAPEHHSFPSRGLEGAKTAKQRNGVIRWLSGHASACWAPDIISLTLVTLSHMDKSLCVRLVLPRRIKMKPSAPSPLHCLFSSHPCVLLGRRQVYYSQIQLCYCSPFCFTLSRTLLVCINTNVLPALGQ